jgi:hypothetical protein
MPILPLEHPESLAATLGGMLYAGEDDEARRSRTWGEEGMGVTFRPGPPAHELGERDH